MYLLAPSILQNFKKILRPDPELCGCTIFGIKMVHLPLIFFGKLLQSNLCIKTSWGTKFLQSLSTGGRYNKDQCITVKTVYSDIWSLYKGSIIFHLITHEIDKNKSACIFVRNKKLCCDKTTYDK